jgi:hypothetical protein
MTNVSQSVLVSDTHLGPVTNFSVSRTFRQLQVHLQFTCYYMIYL